MIPKEFPRCTAAFINAIWDEGDKREAVEWLQRTWDELCWYRAERDRLLELHRGLMAEADRRLDELLKQVDRLTREVMR